MVKSALRRLFNFHSLESNVDMGIHYVLLIGFGSKQYLPSKYPHSERESRLISLQANTDNFLEDLGMNTNDFNLGLSMKRHFSLLR